MEPSMRSVIRIALVCSLLAIGDAYLKTAAEPPSRPPNQTEHGKPPPTFTTPEEVRSVTSRVNKPAYLHCQVIGLEDWAVSWIRRKDLHILTTGLFTFTQDQRFLAMHSADTWTLKLLAPQVNDSGVYMCQVSTEPPISQRFNLTISDSRAYISGSRDLYVKAGSFISLSCTMTHQIKQLYWLHNGSVIHYSHWGPGEQPADLRRVTASVTDRTSSLTVSQAGVTDSGRYTCQPIDAQADHVSVHVLTDEHPAAMQHGLAVRGRPCDVILAVMVASGVLWMSARVS